MKWTVPCVVAALIASAMALVLVRYESRLAFAELHRLDTGRDDLNVEYGRLLLERATWSLSQHVEEAATSRLSMQRPGEDSVITLVVPAEAAQ